MRVSTPAENTDIEPSPLAMFPFPLIRRSMNMDATRKRRGTTIFLARGFFSEGISVS